MLTDRLDVAIASINAAPAHLAIEPMFREQIWLFGPSGSKLPRGASLKYLSALPLLLARRGNATRDLLERHVANKGLTLNVVVETDSTQLIEDLVKAGTGYTAAPYFGHSLRYKEKQLSGAPLADLTIERCLISRKDRPTTRAMREFLALLRLNAARQRKEGGRAR